MRRSASNARAFKSLQSSKRIAHNFSSHSFYYLSLYKNRCLPYLKLGSLYLALVQSNRRILSHLPYLQRVLKFSGFVFFLLCLPRCVLHWVYVCAFVSLLASISFHHICSRSIHFSVVSLATSIHSIAITSCLTIKFKQTKLDQRIFDTKIWAAHIPLLLIVCRYRKCGCESRKPYALRGLLRLAHLYTLRRANVQFAKSK